MGAKSTTFSLRRPKLNISVQFPSSLCQVMNWTAMRQSNPEPLTLRLNCGTIEGNGSFWKTLLPLRLPDERRYKSLFPSCCFALRCLFEGLVKKQNKNPKCPWREAELFATDWNIHTDASAVASPHPSVFSQSAGPQVNNGAPTQVSQVSGPAWKIDFTPTLMYKVKLSPLIRNQCPAGSWTHQEKFCFPPPHSLSLSATTNIVAPHNDHN